MGYSKSSFFTNHFLLIIGYWDLIFDILPVWGILTCKIMFWKIIIFLGKLITNVTKLISLSEIIEQENCWASKLLNKQSVEQENGSTLQSHYNNIGPKIILDPICIWHTVYQTAHIISWPSPISSEQGFVKRGAINIPATLIWSDLQLRITN